MGRGRGITIFKVNRKNGAMRENDVQPDAKVIGKNPTYVVFHPTVPVFYCTNEDAQAGDIRSIKFNPKNFACALLSV